MCERFNGKLCSDHGDCLCDKCHCNPGWSGDACECSTSTDSCKGYGKTICSLS